jgi:hypothetical protein
VIDLEAEEIRTDAETHTAKAEDDTARAEERWTSEPAAAPPQKTERKRMAGWIIAALVLGLIAGAWLYRGVLASYFPSNEMKAMQARLDALDINTGSLTDQLAQLRQAADGATQAAGEAGKAADQADQLAQQAAEGLGSLDSKLGNLDQRVASAETALGQAQADLDGFRKSLSSAASSGASSGPAVDTAVLASLGQRLDALEKDVASLKSSASQGGGSDTASVTSALSQALSDLKAKVAVGAPYAPEYDRISRMVPAAAGLEAVGARAVEGLPNAQGLAAELRAAIPTLPQPAPPAAEDDSYLGSLMTSLSGLVTVRNTGETDWPSVAGKAAAFAEAGDLDQAVGVIETAEGEKPMVLTQWRDRAASRLQLEAALDQVSEAVLRQITALGGAQGGGAQ